MPKHSPLPRILSPVRSAPSEARPPDRSIGTCPAPEKNVRCSQPLMPRPSKYSALATKVTRRGITSGMNSQSEYDRWLLARMAGPSVGTPSAPSARGRKIVFRIGPISTHLSTQ